MSMQIISKPYACTETRRTVTVRVRVEWFSGIGDDWAEPVELQRACTQLARCPRAQQCPLTASDEL